jgi:hypothetical protein
MRFGQEIRRSVRITPAKARIASLSSDVRCDQGRKVMEALARRKAEMLTRLVSTDPRWDIQDEVMCQVFGFTMFGYVFGVGRIICFMDVGDIQSLASNQLIGLGVGPKYAQGMMESAHEIFTDEGNTTIHSQLIAVGHDHIGSEDLTELVDSVFLNTEQIRNIPS